MHTVDIQHQSPADSEYVPTNRQLQQWSARACAEVTGETELTIRITGIEEMQALNRTYRGKNYPTNVLSFPADLPEELDLPLLGDIIICSPVVNQQAKEQGKPLQAHWAHMVVHGTLHLIGYDHIETQDAEEMESKEIEILQSLGFENPYEVMENQ